MQAAPTHAEVAHPHVPSRAPVVAAIAALLIGGAIATGVWWLTDNDVNILPQPEPAATRVIVTQPVQPGAGTAAKNEAGVAAAIGGLAAQPGAGTAAKDESGTAAAVGSQYGTSQYRAEVNPSTGYPAYPSPTPDTSQRGPGARTD
jgi:hypothetical protein